MADNHSITEGSGKTFRSTDTAGVNTPHSAVSKADGTPLDTNVAAASTNTLRVAIGHGNLSSTLLSAVTATGAGSGVSVGIYREFTFYFVASSVTSGGTVAIEALMPDNSTWVPIHSQPITANTASAPISPIYFRGVFNQIRANLTARTDGTFTVYMLAGT